MKLQQYLRYSYLAGLVIVIVGMTFLNFLVSVGLLFLIVVWLFDIFSAKDLKRRFSFKHNKALFAFISIYLLYIVGLCWTSNFSFAGDELFAKIPILILPVIIATSKKLTAREIKRLCWIYFGATIVGSFLVLYTFIFDDVEKAADLVWFNSYTIFGLNLLLCIILCVWIIKPVALYLTHFENYKGKIIYGVLIVWFLAILILLKDTLTLGILAVTAAFIAGRFLFYYPSMAVRWGTVAMGVFIFGYLIYYSISTYQDMMPKETKILAELDKTTSRGGIYTHDIENNQLENGYWVYMYVCEPELKEAWKKRSNTPYDTWDLDKTLIRFLTGKGWRKDAESVEALTDSEIHLIEHGVANHKYVDGPAPLTRIRILLWEIHAWRTVKIESISGFFESYISWEMAWDCIKDNFWNGVGTGDAQDAQMAAYKASKSTLSSETPRNQYLSIWLSFGIIGLIWFLFAVIYPAIKTGKFHSTIYLAFFVALVASMFTDDTLRTQAGTAIFALFNALFLFATPDEL
ncbi:MAG: O-antigen ligase family protein [Bacteroidales bacterium]|jgi:hypothetical protein|nr:O-antigen ligase family protein [Bacteroidales bacterium]